MKKVLIGLSLFVFAGLAFAFYMPETEQAATAEAEEIKWYSWEEAMEANKKNPKKVFIDVYTDWCGWCKRMDATTFKDPQVVEYLNTNFYPVKFDAEQKESVTFDGHTFKFIDQGRRGVHELAYALLDGQLGYPAYVYLNEKMERITVSPGYKPAETLMTELKYIGGDHYKTQSFKEFTQSK